MIVADANVVTYLFVEGPFTAAAREAFAQDPDWRMPLLWRFEFANALIVLVRAGDVRAVDAEKRLSRGISQFRGREQEVSPRAALRIALRNRLSAYDAQYVALAQALGVRCLTQDRMLLERAPSLTMSLSRFLAR